MTVITASPAPGLPFFASIIGDVNLAELGFKAARQVAAATWEKACAWDGIAPHGAFAQRLSAENPFRAEAEAAKAAERSAYRVWRSLANMAS